MSIGRAKRPHSGAKRHERSIGAALAELAEAQDGLVSRGQLLGLGLGRRGVQYRLQTGRLRRAADGAVIDKTFRAGEKFRSVRTEARKMQFLYADGSDAHFMDTQSYDQMTIPEPTLAEPLRWLKPSDEVDVLFIDDQPSDLQLPSAVNLQVSETEPGVKGDTASGGGNKPATLETGATISVPLFIEPGETIRVDTRSGEYVSRA